MLHIICPRPSTWLTCIGTMLVSLSVQANTLYLCKAYSGGQFWSARPCGERQALIERMVSVPAGMPFEQQVQLGEQARADGERLRQPMAPAAAAHKARPTENTHRPHPDECVRLAQRIEQLDAQARQPQSGERQDKLAAQRRKVRERQVKVGC